VAAKIKDDYIAHLNLARKSLERAIAIGLALCEVKRACGHGNWLTWLEENAPFGRERAADFMRVALNKAKCGHLTTFEEALRFLSQAEAQQNASASQAAPADEPPLDLADGHGDAYEPPEDRRPHAGEGEPIYTPRPRRRRSRLGPKNGEVVFDWKAHEAIYGKLLRQVDEAGRRYNAHNSPAAKGLRHRLSEWDKDFRQWAKQLSKQKPPGEG
jgi:hypothetical protein